jgi:outer membrane lipoprotein LolB
VNRRLFSIVAVASFALFFIAGCAIKESAIGQKSMQTSVWNGKLFLRTHADPGNQQVLAQTFNASFELQGNAQAGLLRLSTPLGTTAALIEWTPHEARLNRPGETQSFANLDALSQQLLGAVVPVAGFFDWLRGIDRPINGWSVDLSNFEQGKIGAQRQLPPPAAELRLLLEP